MIDLKQRFAELRDEDRHRVPRFAVEPRRRHFVYRWAFALLVLVLIVTLREQRTSFTDADRAAARSITGWHAPTDVLLKGATR